MGCSATHPLGFDVVKKIWNSTFGHSRISRNVSQQEVADVMTDAIMTQDAAGQEQDAPQSQNEEKPRRPLAKIFDLYILKKFLGTFFFIILLLLVIIVMFDINEKLDAMLNAPLKETIFKYFLNFIPYFLNQFAPLFVFISVIFFTSRLADRSEITAMLASGISFKRLTLPYMVAAAIIAAGTLVLSLYIIPPSNVKRIEYTNKWVKNKRVDYGDNIQLQLRPGVMMYMQRYDNINKIGSRMSIDTFKGDTLVSRITAQNAQFDTLGRWKLTGCEVRTFNALKEHTVTRAQIDTTLRVNPKDFLIAKNDQETLTSPELRKYIEEQKSRGVSNIQMFEIEYERRYAMTAAAFILTIIGLSLSSRKVRGGMGVNIGIGLLLSFSYILFMMVTQTFAVNGYTSPRVAMWIPNAIYTIIAVVLYCKARR